MKQPLLLPKDIANLRSMRKHEVFLGLKRDLAMVSSSFFTLPLFFSSSFIHLFLFFHYASPPFQAIQVAFRAEKMVNSSYRMMKKEEGR